MRKDFSIGFTIGLVISYVLICNADWVDWKVSNVHKKGVTYEMFYLMRHPNEILKTPHQAIKIIYGEDYWCLIKKNTFQDGDEIKILK